MSALCKEDGIKEGSNTKILVVDDEPNILSLLKMALGRTYAVDTAGEIADALDLLEENSYALLIVDLCLGHESGITLATYIHENNIPTEVIIITGHSSDESVIEAVDIGVTHYLSKPIDISELGLLVDQALHTREFTEKTALLANDPSANTTEVQSHLKEVLGLYSILLTLSRTTSLKQTVKLFLRSIMNDFGCSFGVVGVLVSNRYHLFVRGDFDRVSSPKTIEKFWSKGAMDKSGLTKELLHSDDISIIEIDSENRDFTPSDCSSALVTPLANFGDTFGFVALYGEEMESDEALGNLFYTLIPVVSPIIYRGILEDNIKKQAKTDGLTGIANRRMLEETLYRYIQQVVRYNRDIAIVMMDIDNFKQVNDKYGHLVGDNVLKDLVACVNRIIRGSDIFARYGGEEFVLVLPDTDVEGAYNLSERIRKEVISIPFSDGKEEFNYTVSFGVASYRHNIDDKLDDVEHQYTVRLVETLLLKADEALYTAKRTGKNKVVVYNSGSN